MNFQTPLQALAVLGLDGSATKEDIKSAYHRMAAYFHPDAGKLEEGMATDAFLRVREAYDYLMDAYEKAYEAYLISMEQTGDGVIGHYPAAPKIIGSGQSSDGRRTSREEAQERQRQERRLRQRKQARLKKRDEELAASMKEELSYEEAMTRIHAIRAAEIAAQILVSRLNHN